MREDDRNWFKPEEYPAEIPCLLTRKLLVSRVVGGVKGEEQRTQFRHDRVWDFFMAAAFLADPDLWQKYLDDARFRGVYLRIAETWDVDDAKRVRDRLVMAAARTVTTPLATSFLSGLMHAINWRRARYKDRGHHHI
jgi:hypothetical protein